MFRIDNQIPVKLFVNLDTLAKDFFAHDMTTRSVLNDYDQGDMSLVNL